MAVVISRGELSADLAGPTGGEQDFHRAVERLGFTCLLVGLAEQRQGSAEVALGLRVALPQ